MKGKKAAREDKSLIFRATLDPLLGEAGISYGSGGSWTRLDGGRLNARAGKILIEKTAEAGDLVALRKALADSIWRGRRLFFEVHWNKMTETHQICFTDGESSHRLAGPSFTGPGGKTSLLLSHMMSDREVADLSGRVSDALAVAKAGKSRESTGAEPAPLPAAFTARPVDRPGHVAAFNPLPKQAAAAGTAGAKMRKASEKGGR